MQPFDILFHWHEVSVFCFLPAVTAGSFSHMAALLISGRYSVFDWRAALSTNSIYRNTWARKQLFWFLQTRSSLSRADFHPLSCLPDKRHYFGTPEVSSTPSSYFLSLQSTSCLIFSTSYKELSPVIWCHFGHSGIFSRCPSSCPFFFSRACGSLWTHKRTHTNALSLCLSFSLLGCGPAGTLLE